MTKPDELVHLEVADQVATITLDSPANRNALSRRLVAELTAHLEQAGVRRRPGRRAHPHRHDVLRRCGHDRGARGRDGGGDAGAACAAALVVALPKPVVAVVRGHARAGGVGLVGACDVALVSDQCTFAFSESLLGSGAGDHLADDEQPARRQGRGAQVPDRCDVRRRRGGPRRPGHPGRARGRARRSCCSLVAELRRRRRRDCARPSGCSTSRCSTGSTTEGEELVALSAELFASDEAREGMRAFRERRPARVG